MLNRTVTVDFSERRGSLKPVSGLNGGPVFGPRGDCDLTETYRGMNIPAVRVSGVGSHSFLDIHELFPDPALDPRMELSYNFKVADERLSAISAAGAEIFLTLGELPDPYGLGGHRLPRDRERWAEVCLHILRHYNEGWANGFKMKIRYAEIWSRPDEGALTGTQPEEYYELYRTVAVRLKERFPRLKVGGYSSGGFYSLNHYNATEKERGYVSFLEGFLSYISKKEHQAPLDFLTWRCIAETPEEISLHSSYAKSYLTQYGFKRAESLISEIDLAPSRDAHIFRREYPALLASALIIAEKSSADGAFYRDADPKSPDNSLFSLDDNRTLRPYAAAEVLGFLGRIWALGAKPAVSEDYRREIYTLAASGESEGAILLVTRDYSGTVEVSIRGSRFTEYSVKGLIGGGERGAGVGTGAENLPLTGGRIALRTGKCEVYMITLR